MSGLTNHHIIINNKVLHWGQLHHRPSDSLPKNKVNLIYAYAIEQICQSSTRNNDEKLTSGCSSFPNLPLQFFKMNYHAIGEYVPFSYTNYPNI
jgi:hypothetical protein